MTAAKQATVLQPEWAIGWLTLGRARLNAGSFGEAAAALQTALTLDDALREEVADDLSRAKALQLQSDEVELALHTGTTIRLQQWRDAGEATLRDVPEQQGCVACAGAAEPRAGTGTMIWECGIVLAKLLDHVVAGGVALESPLHAAFAASSASPPLAAEAVLRGMNVVELGAGTGIGGLAAAALGAQVELTDVAAVLPLLAANAASNHDAIMHASGKAVVTTLDWEVGAPTSDISAQLVLAADVLYHRDDGGRQLEAFTKVVGRLTKAEDGRLLLVHKARHASLENALSCALRTHAGMILREVPLEHHHPDYRSPSIHVYVGERVTGDDTVALD